jgi:hypothetical protein
MKYNWAVFIDRIKILIESQLMNQQLITWEIGLLINRVNLTVLSLSVL